MVRGDAWKRFERNLRELLKYLLHLRRESPSYEVMRNKRPVNIGNAVKCVSGYSPSYGPIIVEGIVVSTSTKDDSITVAVWDEESETNDDIVVRTFDVIESNPHYPLD